MHARQTFPVKVLLGRLEQGGAAPWSSFLPDHLRPKEVSAKVFHESASSVKAKAEPKPRRGDYTPVGISVFGRVWEYSQDAAGCREVQLAIEMADEENRLRIVAELHDHVWDAACCPHANHVLQKCILVMHHSNVQFIVDVLVRQQLVSQAARHKYACRIVQRLIERCPAEQTTHVLQALIRDAQLISCHAYGNYVMQHVLQHSSDSVQEELCGVLEEHLPALSSDVYGAAVVSCAMSTARHPCRVALARAILKEPSVLVRLACSRHGHGAARDVLQVLEGTDRTQALRILHQHQNRLQRCRYGRIVAGIQ
ncbi:unnamed protein product [Durusdinium trenchii]|uniref:PUM-HD domain-containing protein n=1 Tax=Durusdinium trenchii TaxID=1381693 RepID=A0ABP0Q181_9DINO